jgi:hypothetical protein
MSESPIDINSTSIDTSIDLGQGVVPEELPLYAKTVQLMERFHAEEIFRTPEDSKQFLDSLNFKDFTRWLNFVNGVEREIPRSDRGIKGNSVVMSESALFGSEVMYQPPHQGYRKELMELAFDKAQSADDPRVAALTLGFAINAVHPYPDGNGRTARIVTALLSQGFDGSEESRQYYSALLENQKGRDVINPNPASHGVDNRIVDELAEMVVEKTGHDSRLKRPVIVLGGYGDAMAGEYTSDVLALSPDISDNGRNSLQRVLQNRQLAVLSIAAALPPERISPHIHEHNNGSVYIDADALVPSLSEEEITKLLKSSLLAERKYVKCLIDFSDRADASLIVDHYLGSRGVEDAV